MKYKVGDKVRVRSDLDHAERYGLYFANSDMVELRGKVVTISSLKGSGRDSYQVEEQRLGNQWWTDEMFDGLAESGSRNKYKVGDRVKIRRDLKRGRNYDGNCFCTESMARHAGEVVTIKRYDGEFPKCFAIKEHLEDCDWDWNWSESMLEGLAEPEFPHRKYKVGDRVRVRRDLEEGDYGDCYASITMAELAGQVVTISATCAGGRDNLVLVDGAKGCPDHWYWSFEMFEGLAEEPPFEEPPFEEPWTWEDLF